MTRPPLRIEAVSILIDGLHAPDVAAAAAELVAAVVLATATTVTRSSIKRDRIVRLTKAS